MRQEEERLHLNFLSNNYRHPSPEPGHSCLAMVPCENDSSLWWSRGYQGTQGLDLESDEETEDEEEDV